ncbi:hypothetical protein GOP47_0000679 [Adiantum capillus-veneris]|uniref:Signal peptide peptidase n=1 Tax=Adiantum capillus-veneris TaxID=13818 RepID=A0A9D4VDF7_ADICA|nr:hypothetical protein GOP47_0000679 [Adiantum capillus-veneris]
MATCYAALSHLLSPPHHSSCCHQWLSVSNCKKLRSSRVVFCLSSSLFCSRRHVPHIRRHLCTHICCGFYNEQQEDGIATETVESDAISSLQKELRPSLEHNDNWEWKKTARELVAYGLMFAAVPLGSMLPRLQYSGAFYFVFLALWSVYVGSHRSLQRSPPQKMSFKQGLAVPIMCSISLFGFYCLLRFYPELDLRTFVSIYLGFAGSLAVASNLVGPVRYILPDKDTFSWRINIPQWLLQDEGRPVHFTVTAADCIALLVGIGAAIASRQSGAPFTVNNFIAVCIVTELLNLLSLGSFTTAAAMLCGLLLYDVFWVFGSPHVFGDNVMLTVATSTAFEGPMKLIFPSWNVTSGNPYSVLGLGDIAAPGLLIALMLRFDRSRSTNFESDVILERIAPKIASAARTRRADKTYFVTCMVAYLVGLAVTFGANSVSGAAQPALLYLVPLLLVGIFLMASYRSEASLLLDFMDETPVGEE